MESGLIAAMVVLALFAGYIISSFFFLKFPLLLHKKKKLAFFPMHISHRGGAAENLENTMAAFQHAVSLGTQMLELDCHLTKDGQVVVSHDISLKRTCDHEVAIADTNFAELPMLKPCLGLDFNSYTMDEMVLPQPGALMRDDQVLESILCSDTMDEMVLPQPGALMRDDQVLESILCSDTMDEMVLPQPGALMRDDQVLESILCSDHQVNGEDRKIPLLKEVFTAFPDMPVNVDIKVNNDQLISEVNSLIQAFGREHITAWGNHSAAVVEKLYQTNPNIPLIFSLRRVAVLIILFYTGLLPFVPIKESLLEVVMPSIIVDKRNFKTEFSTVQTILFKIMDVLLMRPALIQHLNKRGIQTYMWVLNSEDEFERAFRLGATGVMTDFPTMLKHYLDLHQPGWR